jgi:syntaxin 1B/2/3
VSHLKDQAQASIARTTAVAKQAKDQLDRLAHTDQEMRRHPNMGEGTPGARMRENLTAALRRKLAGIMTDFNAMRTRLEEEYKDVVERRVYTVTGQMPDPEEVERIIEHGEAEAIFQKAILEQGRGRVVHTVAEIMERHDAFLQLERGLMDLHQVFLDMAVLVETQGEMLNNIETHIKQTQDYVNKGVDNLHKAREKQKNTRKWMCIGIGITLIVVLIIVLTTVQPWK